MHRILRAFVDHPGVAIIVAAATVVGAIFAVLAVTESRPPAADEPAIAVDPVAGLMPRCLTLRGTAPDLADKELWVAFRGSGASDYYYLRPTRDANNTRWQVRDTVGDGTGGRTHEFFVFFVDKSLSEFIRSIQPVSNDVESGAYFYTTSLPPGVSVQKPQLTLVSADDPAECT